MLPEKRMNIKELFMEYKGDYIPEEIDWGDPVGREKDIFKDDAKALDPFYSSENIGYIRKSVQELRNGKGTEHELIEND